MKTPRHHLDEAQTCLELARLMIDPHAARILRAAAAQHIVRATELEAMRMKLGEALRYHYDVLPTLPERLYALVQQLERKGQNPRTDVPRLP
jgi:hypothetical protein